MNRTRRGALAALALVGLVVLVLAAPAGAQFVGPITKWRIGRNLIAFFAGAAGLTPHVMVSSAGGKAGALAAGSGGAGFWFDQSGTFAISTDTNAAIVSGQSGAANVSRLVLRGAFGVTVVPGALQTCASSIEGTIAVVPGAGAVASKFCGCSWTPTGSVAAWVNLYTGAVGTTTTCP